MSMREKLGLCQWFHFGAFDDLDRCMAILTDLGVKHLRTGISWADYLRPGGKVWYDHQMSVLRASGLEVLLSIWHTPPSISEGNSCASPPACLKDYADFIHVVIEEYGDSFSTLELWNEPNNRLKWDFENFDPEWRKFGEMVGGAGYWARRQGVRTCLGGMIPVDAEWLQLMEQYGALGQADIVGIHGFPGMWWEGAPNWDWCAHWQGWSQKVKLLAPVARQRPIWITETGLATWDMALKQVGKHDLQVELLREAARAPVDRVYWYCVMDLDPKREAIEGFHVDENEYHLGLCDYAGNRKPAYDEFKRAMQGRGVALQGAGEGLHSCRM